MRTFLLMITTILLTALGLLYVQQANMFPGFFALVSPTTAGIPDDMALFPTTGADCTTPRNTIVHHGELFLSFQDESASLASGGCVAKSTICNNGSWSADQEPYTHASCTLQTPKTCEVNGFIYAHGQTQTFYKLDTKTQTCVSKERTCTDGKVDGDDSYTYLSCPSSCPSGLATPPSSPTPSSSTTTTTTKSSADSSLKTSYVPNTNTPVLNSNGVQPNCPSPSGGAPRAPGQQGTYYPSATVPFGKTCEQATIVCAYGSLRLGTAAEPGVALPTKPSTTCTVMAPASCTSACGEVKNGEQVTTYEQSIIPHGNGQTCADLQVVSTCDNGTLTPAAGGSCTCQIAPPASCTAPNGQTVAHGNSLTLYESAEIKALPGDGSDTCVRQWRQCVNGTFFDWNNNEAPFTFKYPTCTVLTPPPGGGPGGNGVSTSTSASGSASSTNTSDI